jgi:transcriptional regulator with XRE-family HTH domain
MRQTLDNQLAIFLRKRRGEITYAAFAKKLGITPSSLFRLENCQQSITLKTLQQLMDRLKCGLPEIFPPGADS